MDRFAAHVDGVLLTLFGEEADALTMLPEMLNTVGEVPGDPAASRLTVAAYPDDPEANAEYATWLRSELEVGRAADRSAVEASLAAVREEPVVLSMGEAEAWLIVLNEARLTLAARLEISEEGWGDDFALEDMEPPMAFLHFLTYLHGELTDVLLEKL
jgi:hypothetical protein